MKTKEEILDCIIQKYNGTVNDMSKFDLNNREKAMFAAAMDEYAKELAIHYVHAIMKKLYPFAVNLSSEQPVEAEVMYEQFIKNGYLK